MIRWIESVGQDLRYAVRGLRKSAGFTLVSVLTLAIGIGGTTAVFSVINGILLRPLPYPDQDRLVAVSNVNLKEPKYSWPVSATDVAHWRADNRVFETLEFVSHADMVAMSSAGSGERVGVQHLSARLLPMLGVKAFMGSIPTDDVSEQKGSLRRFDQLRILEASFQPGSERGGQRDFRRYLFGDDRRRAGTRI